MSTPPGAAAPARRENIFTRKIGPLPMWAWLLIATGIILAWAWYRNRQNPSSSPTNTANASQVPQFVNQTYTTVTPPTAPNPVPTRPPKDKDRDKDHDDDEDDEDGKKHKKHPRRRRHPDHGDDSLHGATGINPGSQFTPPHITPRI